MEIEYKWIPEESLKQKVMSAATPVLIEQGYLCHEPVIRVRKHGDEYYMTYKGRGTLVREEYNLPLNENAFKELLSKCEGKIIRKERYTLPYQTVYPDRPTDCKGPEGNLVLELDIFKGELEGLCYLEIEFCTENDAKNFNAPEEFGRNVTFDPASSNSALARR